MSVWRVTRPYLPVVAPVVRNDRGVQAGREGSHAGCPRWLRRLGPLPRPLVLTADRALRSLAMEGPDGGAGMHDTDAGRSGGPMKVAVGIDVCQRQPACLGRRHATPRRRVSSSDAPRRDTGGCRRIRHCAPPGSTAAACRLRSLTVGCRTSPGAGEVLSPACRRGRSDRRPPGRWNTRYRSREHSVFGCLEAGGGDPGAVPGASPSSGSNRDRHGARPGGGGHPRRPELAGTGWG
jgi:hypothetical protein